MSKNTAQRRAGTDLRPECMNDTGEIDYEITQKGDAFENPKSVVSRKSVADLVFKSATSCELEVLASHAARGVNGETIGFRHGH